MPLILSPWAGSPHPLRRARGPGLSPTRLDAAEGRVFLEQADEFAAVKDAVAEFEFGNFGAPVVQLQIVLAHEADAGVNFVEASPSAAAWARAVPAIAQLRPGFTAPGAVLLPGASTSPDFDIYQLQSQEEVRENAFSFRFDYRVTPSWTMYTRVFSDQGTQARPEGISGRLARLEQEPINAIFNLNGTTKGGMVNEFKVGYNRPNSTIAGVAYTCSPKSADDSSSQSPAALTIVSSPFWSIRNTRPSAATGEA